MKKTCLLTVIILSQLLLMPAFGQPNPCNLTMQQSLQQTADILSKQSLWNIKMNAPIIIIDHQENKTYFTGIENGQVLEIREDIWDDKIPLANSTCEYNGKTYVTIVYASLMNAPCEQRIGLLSHEIFHLQQKSLGIQGVASTNQHMDQVQGRALLQIELEALRGALDGNSQDLYNALYIRSYRQSLYPQNNEDLYELNEGLAEYTGVMISSAAPLENAKSKLKYDIKRGYTNAFGYITGFAYATILDKMYPSWKSDPELITNGMVYLIKKTDPKYSVAVEKAPLEELLKKYDYDNIIEKEQQELASFGDIASFEALLKPETAKLLIKNNGISFTYNPNDRIVSLTDAVLLKNLTLMGAWGKIEIRSGIVRMNNWSAFLLLPPTKIEGDTVEGDDYKLKLNEGWKISNSNEIYTIVKE